MHTEECIVTKVSRYKYFHFLSKCLTRQIIANSLGTTFDRGYLVQSEVVMLAMFDTMFEMFKHV